MFGPKCCCGNPCERVLHLEGALTMVASLLANQGECPSTVKMLADGDKADYGCYSETPEGLQDGECCGAKSEECWSKWLEERFTCKK